MSQLTSQAASLDQHAASARRAHRNKIVSAAEAVRNVFGAIGAAFRAIVVFFNSLAR